MEGGHSVTRDWSHRRIAEYLHTFPDNHPVQIALRTYALALSLSLGPAVAGFAIKPRWTRVRPFLRIIHRELAVTGFAFAITVAVAGGSALKSLLQFMDKRDLGMGYQKAKERLPHLGDAGKTLLANALSATAAILLMHRRHPRSSNLNVAAVSKPSPTLDLTLLLVVRAVDAVVRGTFFPSVNSDTPSSDAAIQRAKQGKLAGRLDASVFWAASARIMWCFFYEPQRLPRSYNKWIMKLASIDPRILEALRAIRDGRWSYIDGVSYPPDILSSLSHDLGYPSVWGNPSQLPSHGGPSANAAWKTLGVKNRAGLGGVPCELVHGGVGGHSCLGNATIRGTFALAEAMLIYVPVHFLPILLARPHRLTKASNVLQTLFSAIRSATFLSSFVSSIWVAVCLTRTLLLARLMPWVSHDFWDGPHGCAFIGSLVCGSTIWIEQGRRRGEMALYVLPRAIRTCLPKVFLESGRRIRLLERIAFVASLTTLLTASTHKPNALRGLSRWTLAFVINGPNAGFWGAKRDVSEPSTPKAESSHP